MSVQATSWVIQHSKHKGSALLLMIMIANHAHADGTGAYPAVTTLASECRMSDRQIKRLLPELEASGELVVFWSRGRRSHEYAIRMGKSNSDILSLLIEAYEKEHPDTNHDNLSPLPDSSTVTSEHSNSDISDAPTVTFPAAHIKEEPSLEKNKKEKRQSPAAAPKSTKAQERMKTRPDMRDNEWLYHLASLEENQDIDVNTLYDRMVEWCRDNRKQPSRLRLLKWLDGERSAVPMTAQPRPKPWDVGRPLPPEIIDEQLADLPDDFLEVTHPRPAENVNPDHRALWTAFTDRLKQQVNIDVYNAWFKHVEFDGADIENSRLKVRANWITNDWIIRYYSELIYETLVAVGLAEWTLEWTVEQDVTWNEAEMNVKADAVSV